MIDLFVNYIPWIKEFNGIMLMIGCLLVLCSLLFFYALDFVFTWVKLPKIVTKFFHMIFRVNLYLAVIILNILSVYLLLSSMYILVKFDDNLKLLFASIIVTFCIICFALTSIPVMIYKLIFTRRLSKREADFIIPILHEVYNSASSKFGFKKRKIDIRIVVGNAGNIINGYALGGSTILLTGACIKQASAYSIKGLLAHELGHLIHGDSKRLMFFYTLNLATLVLFYVAIGISFVIECAKQIPFINFFAIFISIWILGTIWLLNKCKYLINYCLISLSRVGEYKADNFAKKIGYGENLINYLDKYCDEEINNFFETHPHTEFRIEALSYDD